jgi:hypothetical protein
VEEQWNVDDLGVEGPGVRHTAVLSELLAVIAGQDEQGIFVPVEALE